MNGSEKREPGGGKSLKELRVRDANTVLDSADVDERNPLGSTER